MRMICSKNPLHFVDQENKERCAECGADLVEFTRERQFLMGMMQRALKEAPVPQGVKGAARVRIKLCTACGAPLWRGTDPISGKHSEVVLDEGEDDPREGPPLCQDCQAIRYRYPELYFWINNTAYWRRNRMEVTQEFRGMSGGKRSRKDYADAIAAMGGTPPTPLEEVGGEPKSPYPPPGPDTSRKRKKVKPGAKKKAKRGH